MQSSYHTYLKLIKQIVVDSNHLISIQPDEIESIATLASEHRMVPFLLPYFRNTTFYPEMAQTAKNVMLNYYQIDQFMKRTVSLLEDHGISCILLKGLSLAAYYPNPDYRKLGDLDLYLTDPNDLAKAKDILAQNGYIEEEELSDHHVTYQYIFPQTGRHFILELHYRIVGIYQYEPANQMIDHIYSKNHLVPEQQEINGKIYQVLPPTEYVFYMIHHMLKHYLYSGFGIRLLCDFIFYLNKRHEDVDFSKIHAWCKHSRITHLYEIILETCRTYLGLSILVDPEVHYDLSACEAFLGKVLKDGDMGTDVSKELVGSTSYKRINLFTYFKEGHVQMKVRFPKASRLPLLWPALWIISFVCFLKNTYTVRNTTLLETLRTFKKNNQQTKLIRIFENSDS